MAVSKVTIKLDVFGCVKNTVKAWKEQGELAKKVGKLALNILTVVGAITVVTSFSKVALPIAIGYGVVIALSLAADKCKELMAKKPKAA